MRSFHLVSLTSTHALAKILATLPRVARPANFDPRVGSTQADLCRDFFCRAVGLKLSFFEAAYTTRVSPDLGTAQLK
jgi:hypothetical protein